MNNSMFVDLLHAVDLSLEVWEYLRDNPSISCKEDLPLILYIKIENMRGKCPLCEFLQTYYHGDMICTECPLNYCLDNEHPFTKWFLSNQETMRAKYAGQIVDILHDWKRENF
ncbi:MAG: hypothetical protein WC438_05705 [Candidatus Pacearchaeota archaeon]|jgi:hypothetical protein